jgi:uncharacterized protein YjlB
MCPHRALNLSQNCGLEYIEFNNRSIFRARPSDNALANKEAQLKKKAANVSQRRNLFLFSEYHHYHPHHAEGLVNPKVHGLKNRN